MKNQRLFGLRRGSTRTLDNAQTVQSSAGVYTYIARNPRENEILTRSAERRLVRWNNSLLRPGAVDVMGPASVGIATQKLAEDKIRRLNRVYAVLSGINTLIVRVRERQELFDGACRIAVEQGQFGIAWIGRFDPDTLEVIPVACAGARAQEFNKKKSTADSSLPRGHGLVGCAIRELRPVFDNDITIGPRAQESRRKDAISRGYRSIIALPLTVDGAAVGSMSLFSKEPNYFTEDEIKLLIEVARDISFALEHIAREEKIARLSRIQAVMSRINALIVRARSRQELFDEACRIAVEHGGFSIAYVGVRNPTILDMTPVAWSGHDAESLATTPGTAENLSGLAIKEKRAIFSNDLAKELTEGGPHRQAAVRRGYRSFIVLPLLVDGTAVATISLFTQEPNYFTADELALLNELAGDLSFALDHIEKQERLDYLAYFDVLTGLANRSLFLERVAQCMRSAVGGRPKLALFLIDLERFKSINDTLGQPAGDALLRQVAQWLTRHVRDVGLLARLGADHFAVVLPDVKRAGDVAQLLDKTMGVFLDHPFHLNDGIFRVAAKVGVALFPDDGADADTLFRNAEAALKRAKVSDNRYLFYTPKMTATMAGKLTLENQLRQALDNGEFVLHYQPKVNFASGKLTSAEALIRWNDPRTGLVPPGQFIPTLEETGLIHEVGRWALREAIADYLRWRAAGLAAVRIAVNVSPLQLRNRGFIADVKQAISVDAHASAGLELEITESMIMQDVKNSIAILQAIRGLNVSIAIDDFGTGFSSLSHLSKLPLDTLKIDRSFVNDMTGGPQGLALVSTVISLAHALKLKVVAEGVETEEQSRLLQVLNCNEMQGYLFSKPVPAERFVTMLTQRLDRREPVLHAPTAG